MRLVGCFLAAAAGVGLGPSSVSAAARPAVRNVVLVHGAYADGSGWRGVTEILQRDGFKVSVVQEPETSLAADVAATRLILDQQNGPAVLVGHSYGGAVITEAGVHPKVESLVYVAAFAPDAGQTLKGLSKSIPALAAKDIKPINGFVFVNPEKFSQDFAADVPLAQAKFMAISQVGQSVGSGATPITNPAWKTHPTWAIVATEDHMINPDLERKMYARAHAKVSEVRGSHAIYVSQPKAIAEVIEAAARSGH